MLLVTSFTISWFYRHVLCLDLYCKKEHKKAFNRHCYAYCIVYFMDSQPLTTPSSYSSAWIQY